MHANYLQYFLYSQSFSFLDEEKVLGYNRNNENASEAEINKECNNVERQKWVGTIQDSEFQNTNTKREAGKPRKYL